MSFLYANCVQATSEDAAALQALKEQLRHDLRQVSEQAECVHMLKTLVGTIAAANHSPKAQVRRQPPT